MSRIARKKWGEENMGIKHQGNIMDMFDNQIKLVYRINDKEYDTMAENMSDEEMSLFVTEKPSFAQKRRMIELLNKFINYND